MTACDYYPKTFPGLGGRVLIAVCLLLTAWGLAVGVDMVGMGCSG